MSNKANIEVNAELAKEAASVLSRLGLDLEDATKLFLRRCVLEQKLPFDINSAPTQSAPLAQESKSGTTGGKITQAMVENVWEAFKKYQSEGGELRSIADEVSRSSGMTAGSAFIYLVILENLFEGQRNTRNMKMRDLEFYMERIRAEYGINIYENALSSLEESLPYWESQPLGNFADKVRMYLREHNDGDRD